jgi:hypothetical protein
MIMNSLNFFRTKCVYNVFSLNTNKNVDLNETEFVYKNLQV